MVNGSCAPLIKDQPCSQGPFQIFPEATSRAMAVISIYDIVTLVTRLTGPGVRADLWKNAYPHWFSFCLGKLLNLTAWALLSLWITSYTVCCVANAYKSKKVSQQYFLFQLTDQKMTLWFFNEERHLWGRYLTIDIYFTLNVFSTWSSLSWVPTRIAYS